MSERDFEYGKNNGHVPYGAEYGSQISMANNLTKLTEATARTTGRRYCSTHGSEVSFDAGSYVLRNKTTRWVCFECQKRRNLALPATCINRKE